MRPTIATLAVVTTTALAAPALLTASPATAATPAVALAPAVASATDPVPALKRRFRAHRGVRLSEKTKLIGTAGKPRSIFSRRSGVLEFGRAGVIASDLTSTYNLPDRDSELRGVFVPSRTVTVKGVSYTSGGIFGDSLPEGKKWLRDTGGGLSLVNPAQQLLNPLEPATLKAALAHTASRRPGGTWDGVRTVVHTGSITLGELYRISPALRAALGAKPSATSAALPVTWRLHIGPDGLIRRAVSSYTQTFRGLTSADLTYLNDSRYSSWGIRTAIKPPPAGQVADFDELKVGDAHDETPLPIFGGLGG
ncbi:hypothetical protein GCM10017673_41350 [Streptosporangium violaceochromogenes]|nr:hypothetical protein GCM10017673_41350 [Streptosporangium violaceochromogenes]